MIIRTDNKMVINVCVSGVSRYDTEGVCKESFNFLIPVPNDEVMEWEDTKEIEDYVLYELFHNYCKMLYYEFNFFDVEWWWIKESPHKIFFCDLENTFSYFLNE